MRQEYMDFPQTFKELLNRQSSWLNHSFYVYFKYITSVNIQQQQKS